MAATVDEKVQVQLPFHGPVLAFNSRFRSYTIGPDACFGRKRP
jgi:hypothetical protein